jgi:diguanylate cyclase (GGDEF)-like protein
MATERRLAVGPTRATRMPVAVLAFVMSALAVGLDLLFVLPAAQEKPSYALWAGLLAAAFLLVELVPIHLEWSGQAYSISLSEVPLVIGLLFCPSPLLVAGRVAGAAVALAASRKQPPHKLAFNISLQWLEVSLAVGLFLHLPHHAGGTPMSAAPAVLAAIVASSLLSMGGVSIAVRVSVGQLNREVLASFMRTGVFSVVVNTSVALVLATALRYTSSVAIPMTVMLLAGGAVYRAYVSLRQRHASLEMLYQFTSGINQTASTDQRVREILDRTRRMLRADVAGLLLLAADDNEQTMLRWTDADDRLHAETYLEKDSDQPFADVLATGEVIVIPRGTREPHYQAFLAERGLRDLTIAPLRLDGQLRGALFVANRQGDVASFTDDDGRMFQTVAVQVSSVLDNSRLLDRLTHDSQHDALTGLVNRQCYQTRLRKALADPRPRVAVLLTDLDRFKEINDTLGHHHGDLLIREIARRIAANAPAVATVARLGGDEFALLVPSLTVERARRLAERIRAAIAEPCVLDGVSVDVDASIGIAVAPDHGTDHSVLLKRADMAMYAAKSSQRGVETYDAERDEYSPRRLALASRLRHAIENCELLLHYQPQIDACTGATVGAEALVRWQHPDYGLVPPGEFVPIAEQSGAIGELTLWVLDNAAAQLAEWRSRGLDLGISVNVSMRNLLDASVVDTIARLTSVHRLPPHRLTLEITESHLMNDPARTLPVLHRLAALGTRLSVDDFGTGYSSLSYLHELPVHEVKIDKSFLRHDEGVSGDGPIVRAIVSMSQHLGLETVAEGIEDEETGEALARLGCTRLQGFHIARPMPAADFLRWLGSRRIPRQFALPPASA